MKGKVALITGGSHGIGRVMADEFSKKEISVVVADLDRPANGRLAYIKTDLGKEPDIKKMIEFAVDKFGRLDILVNNARPKLGVKAFPESMAEWDLAMDILLKAPALAAKHALPQLAKNKGSIINIVSTNARFVSHQPAAYHAAKAGLVQLTRALAVELAGQGVRVNAVCPGLVDLFDENRPLTADPVNKAVTEAVIPLKRAARAEEVAACALFLCSEAAGYITGQVLTMDGGETLIDQFHAAREAYRKGKE